MAWETLLGNDERAWTAEDKCLCDLFADHSQIELFHFSDLHKACLGISGKDFDSVLAATPRSLVDQMDAVGKTTLSWAAQRGDSKAVDQLLRCGADPNKIAAFGEGPLHWSLRSKDVTCLQLLLLAKADVDLRSEFGCTALSNAAAEGIEMAFVDVLLKNGADIEAEDDVGRRPLHLAATMDNSLVLIRLLEEGADINAKSFAGYTALDWALTYRRHNILRILLDDPNFRYDRENDPFEWYAVFEELLDIVTSATHSGTDQVTNEQRTGSSGTDMMEEDDHAPECWQGPLEEYV
jgi:ankyrin repeat protein